MNDHTTSPLLPENLQRFLKARAPGNRLGTAVADIGELFNGTEAQLASNWLTDVERQEFKRYSFPKRRAEWLSGRICAKQAIVGLLGSGDRARRIEPMDITIAIAPSGRPFCTFNGDEHRPPGLDFSISHSHGKAVGIAGEGLCGVDIQYLSDTLFKVKDRYCTEIETAILDITSLDELSQLGMLWVAKEAIRKCLSDTKLMGFLDMRLERIVPEHGCHVLHFQLDEPLVSAGTVSAAVHVHGRYALAVCTIDPARLNA